MEEYNLFLQKFERKKTTDDCYTPGNVYDAVAEWVCKEYGLNKAQFVRPFYPGGDYERYDYPDDCVVVDNPPFSILSEIVRFYCRKKIRYFLFAPALTVLGHIRFGACVIAAGVSITYENGAKVNTSFVTNLEDSAARSCPDLYRSVTDANRENERKLHRELPKYDYPDNVVTAAFLNKLSKYGIEYGVARNECIRISALDSQRPENKAIFGKGLLVSENAAAEKATAEKAAAEKAAAEKQNKIIWPLSERERELIGSLDPPRRRV